MKYKITKKEYINSSGTIEEEYFIKRRILLLFWVYIPVHSDSQTLFILRHIACGMFSTLPLLIIFLTLKTSISFNIALYFLIFFISKFIAYRLERDTSSTVEKAQNKLKNIIKKSTFKNKTFDIVEITTSKNKVVFEKIEKEKEDDKL